MKARLTQGDIGSQLVSLAGPMIFGVFSIIIFNLVDTYYIGKLGHRELAAVAFTFPIPLIVGAVAFGIGIAATSFVSMALGSGRSDEVSRYATDSISMVVLLGLILVVVGELTIEPLFLFMGAPKDLIPMIAEYMRVWYLSIPLIVVPMTGNSIIRAMGNTKFPAMVMAVAGLGNFIFDPIFIFGLGPIPAMGLKGAAVATALSRFFTLIAAVYVLKRKYNVLTSPFIPLRKLLNNWRKITQVAFPAFLNNLVNPIAMLVLTKLVASHGEIIVAGFGVGTRIEALFSIVLIGIAASLSPFVGQNYGAKKYSRIKTALFMANKYSSIWIFICGVLLMFFSKNLVSVFNDNPEVIEVASTYLKIMIFSIIGLALMQNSVASHNSIGKSKISLLINLLRIFLIHIPLAVVLGNVYSYEGIYWAGFIANILGGVIGTYFLIKLVKSFPVDSSV